MAELRPAALALVENAQREAQRLRFPFVQREQLFLALLHDETVIQILVALGIDLDALRESVESRLLPGLGTLDDHRAIGMLPTAEQVFQHRSLAAAALLGHTHRGAEHILLGFLLEQNGVVLEALSAMGVTQHRVMEKIKDLHP